MRLVIVKDNKPYTTSILLAEGIGSEHREILQLIKKYRERKIFQTSAFQMQKLRTKGRMKEYYFLYESHP